jgi:hopene-associated glycosyltransferase HpnB
MRLLSRTAALVAGVWAYLLAGHGGFWRTSTARLPPDPPRPTRWPSLAVVVPARDEAEVLGQTLPTLLAQDYPGELSVWLVDDGSTDGTAELARALAGDDARLRVCPAPPPPPGWAGKLNAVRCGVAAAGADGAELLLLTDADIAHHPGSARRLAAAALADDRDLVSLMALLRVRTGWERLLVPAFVYFFAQLYPFARVAAPGRRTAAAAGGCVLVRAAALRRAGGIEAIRGALIDDVALGRLVKRSGARTWLGFTSPGGAAEVRSVRPYPRLADLWTMVSRSAYTQLRHSPALLTGTVAGLGLLYLVPPAAAVAGLLGGSRSAPSAGSAGVVPVAGVAWVAGLAGWAAMAVSEAPVLRLYGLNPLRGLALPGVAALYAAMTVDSARRHARGRGGEWKGRIAVQRGAPRAR